MGDLSADSSCRTGRGREGCRGAARGGHRTGIWRLAPAAAFGAALALTGCQGDNAPAPTVTVTVTATAPTASPQTVTATVTATPTPPAAPGGPDIVVFNGLPLTPVDPRFDVFLSDADPVVAAQIRQTYEVDYAVYVGGTARGTHKGVTEDVGLYAYWQVAFPDLGGTGSGPVLALAGADYPVIPRTPVTAAATDPALQSALTAYAESSRYLAGHALTATQQIDVDLDGDGALEHIVGSGDARYSALLLFGADATVIALLSGVADDDHNTAFHGAIADIDGDGAMEIVLSAPVYEGQNTRVYGYDDGVFSGAAATQDSIAP